MVGHRNLTAGIGRIRACSAPPRLLSFWCAQDGYAYVQRRHLVNIVIGRVSCSAMLKLARCTCLLGLFAGPLCSFLFTVLLWSPCPQFKIHMGKQMIAHYRASQNIRYVLVRSSASNAEKHCQRFPLFFHGGWSLHHSGLSVCFSE